MERNADNRWYDFFSREGERLVRFVRGNARRISEMDAEDIVADVMLGLVSKLETNGSVENIAGYAYRAIRNRIVDYERSSARTIPLEQFMDEDGELPLLSMLSTPAEDDVTPEEQAQRLQKLTEAIGKLEPRQRAVLVATELKGKTFRELSEAWNEPIGTLLSRKSRAVKALRQMLSE